MAELTTAEINHIRRMSGDVCGPNFDVDDDDIQYIHDNVATTDPQCLSSIPLGSTIVWVLEARVSKAATLTNESSDGISTSYSQKYTQLRERLEDWKSKCGMGGGVITIGSFSLGLDACATESEYTSYPSWFTSCFL